MRHFLALCAAAAVATVTVSTSLASGDEPVDKYRYRRSMGNLRPPATTADSARHGSPSHEAQRHRDRPHHEGPHRGYHPYYGGYGRQYYYSPPYYGYDPYYPYYPYPYPTYGWAYPYPPPLYIPAETLYGIQPLKRFFGVDQTSPAVNPRIIVLNQDGKDEAEGAAERATSQRSLDLAWRFIGFGDAHFGNQKYSEAYLRYKKAADAAPNLAAAYFRQGYALIALGNYEQAAKVLKRGLELDPEWPNSDFRNDELYGGNQAAKTAQLDALAKAATDKPNDADLLFLVGVFLHFDGQAARAAPFFERAARLGGGSNAHLRGFMGQIEQAQD